MSDIRKIVIDGKEIEVDGAMTLIQACEQVGVEVPCLLYTSPSPRDLSTSRMPSSA